MLCYTCVINTVQKVSWWSALLVGETGVPGENHRPAASRRPTLSHNVVQSTPRHELDLNAQL